MKMDMHLHSNFSDGKNTIEEMTSKSVELGYKHIAFTDHVWRTTDWLGRYVAEIDRIRAKYTSVNIHSGVEAKVLNLKGDVDAQESFFKKVGLILAAFHRIPDGKGGFLSRAEVLGDRDMALNLWCQAFMGVLENKNVHIIAHPTAALKRYGVDLPLEMKRSIARKTKRCGKILEANIRYQVPDDEFLAVLRAEGIPLSFGSDSHNIRELEESGANKWWGALEAINSERDFRSLSQ